MSTNLSLQNTINQIKYIQNHQEDFYELEDAQYERQLTKLMALNDRLIKAFVADIADQYTEKTVNKHLQSLESFLNDYLADDLETIFGEGVLDLQSPLDSGFTVVDMRRIKTALKKFYKYLVDQRLITGEMYDRVIRILKPQLSAKQIRQMLQKENEHLRTIVDQSQAIFSEQVDAIIKDYFAAFANLYGMISCDQAYRIICRQNPGLSLPSDKFINLIERMEFASAGKDFMIDNSQVQPQIIHPSLRQHPEKLQWLSDQVTGLPFAIPKKSTMLRYAEMGYGEPSPAKRALAAFYRETLGIPQDKVEEYLKRTTNIIRTWTDDNLSKAFNEVNEVLLGDEYGCPDRATLETFIQKLIEFQNNTSRWALRGYSPSQSRMQVDAFELLAGQKALSKRLIKLIKSAQVDPMEIILYLITSDEIDDATAERIQQQLVGLDIPSLD